MLTGLVDATCDDGAVQLIFGPDAGALRELSMRPDLIELYRYAAPEGRGWVRTQLRACRSTDRCKVPMGDRAASTLQVIITSSPYNGLLADARSGRRKHGASRGLPRH